MDYFMLLTDVSVDHEYTQILIVGLRTADTRGPRTLWICLASLHSMCF